MLRDIALGLLCIATFAVATAYVGDSARQRSDREQQRLARLETELVSLRERLAVLAELLADAEPPSGRQRVAPERGASIAPVSASGPRQPVPAALPDPRSDVGEALQQIAAGQPPELRRAAARVLLDANGEDLRLHAVRTLFELDFSAGLDAVSELVSSAGEGPANARSALRALSVLGAIQGGEAEAALRMFATARSALVRIEAGRLLSRRGDPEPIARVARELVPQLQSPDHRQRLQALALLAVAAQPASIPGIVPLLRDPSAEVRERAVRTLGRFGDRSLRGEIERMLSDPIPGIRRTAAATLQDLR